MIKDLLNHIVGNATELSKEEIEESFHHVLFEGEEPHIAFKLYRDKWLFTNKRLIMLDIQGVTGTKKEYHTIPYKSIYHFAVETAGSIDFDSEIDRKSTRLNSSHIQKFRMPSSA